MKANKAPEKIYITPHFERRWFTKEIDDVSVEYTRTDAFINEAAIWFNNNFMVHDEYGVISDSFNTKEEMFEDFKNYMKGESYIL
jgi:hypothetical protein